MGAHYVFSIHYINENKSDWGRHARRVPPTFGRSLRKRIWRRGDIHDKYDANGDQSIELCTLVNRLRFGLCRSLALTQGEFVALLGIVADWTIPQQIGVTWDQQRRPRQRVALLILAPISIWSNKFMAKSNKVSVKREQHRGSTCADCHDFPQIHTFAFPKPASADARPGDQLESPIMTTFCRAWEDRTFTRLVMSHPLTSWNVLAARCNRASCATFWSEGLSL